MDILRRLATALTLGYTLVAAAACSQAQNVPMVSVEQARQASEAGAVTLIDIREPYEHATGVSRNAILLPTGQIAKRIAEIPNAADKPVYLICATQNRSQSVAAALREQGYLNVSYVDGGMSTWVRKGYPVVRPQ
jgi:rhodanese-related sulfurtransferase